MNSNTGEGMLTVQTNFPSTNGSGRSPVQLYECL